MDNMDIQSFKPLQPLHEHVPAYFSAFLFKYNNMMQWWDEKVTRHKNLFLSTPEFLNENDKEMILTERWVTAFKPLCTFYSLKSQHQ